MDDLFIRRPTDTATPYAVVPIYLIHSIVRPFCPQPACWCKTHQQEVTALMQQTKHGEMIALPVTAFADSRTS